MHVHAGCHVAHNNKLSYSFLVVEHYQDVSQLVEVAPDTMRLTTLVEVFLLLSQTYSGTSPPPPRPL